MRPSPWSPMERMRKTTVGNERFNMLTQTVEY